MVTPSTESKPALRKLAYALREANAKDTTLSFLVNAIKAGVFQNTSFVGLFMAHGVEPQTSDIIAEAFRLRKRMAVPAWDEPTRAYRFCEVLPETTFAPGKANIQEPTEKRWIETSALDAILVPGLAFDTAGNRIGHGRGHYDQLLANRRADTRLVALAFDWQIFPSPIPHAAHDVPMHSIITPTRILHVHGHNANPPIERRRTI